MNSDYLNEFLTLAGCLNFRQAARRLFISQSALSRHMDSLEAELHTTLFNRTTQHVSLTPTGQLLLLRAQALLNDISDIKLQIERIESETSNTLRIGVPFYSTEDYLGMIPAAFKQQYPAIKTEYFVDTPSNVYENLLNHKTDMAFLAGYSEATNANIIFIPVYQERLGVVMSSSNPLAKKEYLIFPNLKYETFLFLNDSFFKNTLAVQITELAKKQGHFEIGHTITYDKMESLLIGIAKNDGISISGELIRSQESSFISYRPLVGNNCSRTVCICYRKDNRNPSVQLFIDLYKASSSYRMKP